MALHSAAGYCASTEFDLLPRELKRWYQRRTTIMKPHHSDRYIKPTWRYALAAIAFVALPAMAQPAFADTETPEGEDTTSERAMERAREREYAERLRRAIERSESEQIERAKKRDSELGRQADLTRLQAQISVLERDESTLQGQMRNAETQLLYVRSDPADMSAHAQRSQLESRVSYYRSQLNYIAAEKRNALRQLSDLRESRFR